MASSIGFGTLSTTGSSPRLFGTSSQLDTEAILQATYAAKRLPAVRLESKTTTNEARMAALQDMRSLLEQLRGAANALRNPPGLLGARDNAFEAKQAFFSSSTTTPPGELVGVAIANTAQAGGFDLRVLQLATAEKLSTASAAAADQKLADALNGGGAFAGEIELGVAGGPTATVAVNGDMTIYDLRDAINAQKGTSGVRASVVKIADDEFRLIMTADATGKAITINDLTGIAGGFPTSQLQAAQPAIFEIDGVEVTRLGNQVDDLLGGVTINLFKADPATTISVSVEPGLGDIKARIAEFVDAYNAFRDFVAAQSAVDASGKPAAGAVLYGDRTMRGVTQTLGGVVSGSVAGLDVGALSTLRSIGIELDAGNRLRIDEAKLDNALLTRLDQVRSIFEFRFEASSGELAVFARSNTLGTNAFEVVITDADNDGIPESATIGGVAAEISGKTIKGPAGSAFEGLELIWAGKGSTTIDVHATQGIADRLYNSLGSVVDTFDGAIKRSIDNLVDVNKGYARQIEQIEERALRARELLLERFTAMEAALSLANSMLQQIRAQIDAMTADGRR